MSYRFKQAWLKEPNPTKYATTYFDKEHGLTVIVLLLDDKTTVYDGSCHVVEAKLNNSFTQQNVSN